MPTQLRKNSLSFTISILLLFSFHCKAETKDTDNKLVGSIENNHYISRDKSFSFKLPITANQYTLEKRISDALSSAAAVITMKSDDKSTEYRFEVSYAIPEKENENNFTQAASKTFDWYRRLIQRAWKSPATKIVDEEFNAKDARAAHVIYKQFANNTSGPRYHIFYLADYGERIHLLWTHISLTKENIDEENIIIEALSGPALKTKQSFLSFTLNN